MHILIYIFAALFIALGLGVLFAYYRTRQTGLLFMALAYGAAAGAALARMEGWPLLVGFVVAWLVRFAGLDPEVPRTPRPPEQQLERDGRD